MSSVKRLLLYHSRLTAVLRIVAAVLVVCLLIPPVSAHSPSGMSVTYQELSKELLVSITHAVPNPGEHYINEVTVSINGKVVNNSRYTSQPAPDTFTYTYPVETVTGDEIKVTATCSLAGSIARTLYTYRPDRINIFIFTRQSANAKSRCRITTSSRSCRSSSDRKKIRFSFSAIFAAPAFIVRDLGAPPPGEFPPFLLCVFEPFIQGDLGALSPGERLRFPFRSLKTFLKRDLGTPAPRKSPATILTVPAFLIGDIAALPGQYPLLPGVLNSGCVGIGNEIDIPLVR